LAVSEKAPERAGAKMLRAISNWIGRVFGPKSDNFKALLMADLGIKR
jgi:hypothetical protein